MTAAVAWHDWIGGLGVALIVTTYLLLQLDKLRSDALLYSLLNFTGAALVMLSLAFEFNLSAFMVELFWAFISAFGIVRYFQHRK